MQKNGISSSADPRTRRLLTSRFHLYIPRKFKIYIEFRSFGGICSGILTLQKTRFGGPGKPSFWSVLDYGFLRVFMGFDEFLQVLDGFLRVVAKLLHQKPGFVD